MAKELDFKNFLIGKLRAASRKWPPYNEAKKKAKVNVTVVFCEEDMTLTAVPDTGEPSFTITVYKKAQNRERVAYRCASCGRLFFEYEYLPFKSGKLKGKLKKTNIIATDHIEPVVSLDGFSDWNTFIQRLFFGKLQILCNYPGERNGKKSCHHIKTAKENEVRKQNKKG